MSTLTVLTVGVFLAFGLQAADTPAESQVSDWTARNDAAISAMRQHNYELAAQLFDESAASSKTHSDRVTALAARGIALNRSGRKAEAKAALEQAIAEWTGPLPDGKAIASGVLASVDRSLGDYAGAERVLRAAIGDRTAPTPELATLMVNLADILREEARGNEARVVLDEAGRLPDLSRAARMNVLMETAEMDLDLRLCEESKELWTEVGAIAGNDDPAVDAAVNAGLGESWMVEGNLARAEPLLRKSLQLLRNDPRSSPLQLATALAALGQLYLNEDKLALAAEAVNEAIAKDEESLGTAHPQVGALLEVEAIILSRHGEAQAARDKLERAQVIMSSHFGPESVAVAVVFAGMGEVELRANRPKEAASHYGHALQIFRQAGVEGSEPGLALAARYAAALKAAHLSAKTAPDRGQTVAGNDTARGFREK